jgi:hypothetical protein
VKVKQDHSESKVSSYIAILAGCDASSVRFLNGSKREAKKLRVTTKVTAPA